MEDKLEFLRDSEGFINEVSCPNLNFPPEPFEINLEMLNDISVWEDLEFETKLDESLLFEISQDILDIRIRSLFNCLILKREFSSRGLYLTSLLIKSNPADYTAWYYRLEYLKNMNLDSQEHLIEEFDFTRKITMESIKSYQPWAHRRNLCELANSPFNELEYVKLEITTSPKNQCAWSYLTWLINTYGIQSISNEFQFSSYLLSSDSYNNSSWNYKNFLLHKYKNEVRTGFLIREIVKDFQLLLVKCDNEGLCTYLCDFVPLLETLYKGCIKLGFEGENEYSSQIQHQISSNPDSNNTNKNFNQILKYKCKYECQGPPRLCIIQAIKSEEPSVQLLRLLSSLDPKEQVSDKLSILDPLRSGFYEKLFTDKS